MLVGLSERGIPAFKLQGWLQVIRADGPCDWVTDLSGARPAVWRFEPLKDAPYFFALLKCCRNVNSASAPDSHQIWFTSDLTLWGGLRLHFLEK